MEHQGVAVGRGALARIEDLDVHTGVSQRNRSHETHGTGAHHDHLGFSFAEHRLTSGGRIALPPRCLHNKIEFVPPSGREWSIVRNAMKCPRWTRRSFVGLAVAAGAGTLAGCGGSANTAAL